MSARDVEWQQQINGAVAVVTGAASGMGRALARQLAGYGCHVAIADVNPEGLAETASLLGSGITCTQHLIDVADPEAMSGFAQQVAARHGQVNMIFNNAGVAATGNLEVLPLEDFEWLMGINFWGVVHGCRAFLPYLRQAQWGHIVNTSSIFGLISVPTQSAYHAAKFAVKGFTDSLAQELEGSTIKVSCVMPGGVKTNIVRSSRYVASDNTSPTKEDMTSSFESLANLTSDQAASIILHGVAHGPDVCEFWSAGMRN
jgi:NAD(P)-dependent dehydrogenase (short-subunit alcohol dehydrogenase family)